MPTSVSKKKEKLTNGSMNEAHVKELNPENGTGPESDLKLLNGTHIETEDVEEEEQEFAAPRVHRHFVQAGELSTADSNDSSTRIPLPKGEAGEALLARQDFQLPYDLVYMQQKDNNIEEKRHTGLRENKTEAMQEFSLVKKNIYIHRKEQRLEVNDECAHGMPLTNLLSLTYDCCLSHTLLSTLLAAGG
jgi:hypothetical protein